MKSVRLQPLHVVQRRSGLIPTGGPVAPLGRGRVLLIGDAAGLVSPLTGGGIHTALSFGRRAAQLVSDYLRIAARILSPAFAREVPRYALKRLLRYGFDLAPPNLPINAHADDGACARRWRNASISIAAAAARKPSKRRRSVGA